MNTKAPYQRKLAHPDWQKKRLEILQRDNFQCKDCNSKEKELHIHHIYYLPNTEPQNYPDKAYITLCHECHQREEDKLKELDSGILMRLRRCGGDAWTIGYLIEQIEKLSKNFSIDNACPIFYVGDNIQEYNSCTKEQQAEIDTFRWNFIRENIEAWHKKQKSTNG